MIWLRYKTGILRFYDPSTAPEKRLVGVNDLTRNGVLVVWGISIGRVLGKLVGLELAFLATHLALASFFLCVFWSVLEETKNWRFQTLSLVR